LYLRKLLDSGIDVYMEFQTGMPMETEEHRRENINALQELGKAAAERGKAITVFMSLSIVYPGTSLAYDMFEAGAPRDAFEIFTKWEDQQDELKEYLGRNFAHGTGGIPTGMMNMQAFNDEEIIFNDNKIPVIDAYLAEIRKIDGINLFDYEAS